MPRSLWEDSTVLSGTLMYAVRSATFGRTSIAEAMPSLLFMYWKSTLVC